MTYCKAGDKPQIKYKFGNGNERIYKSEFAPIEVIQKGIPVDAKDEYSAEGYGITVNSSNFNGTAIVVSHEEFVLPPNPDYFPFSGGATFLFLMYCGQTSYYKSNPCTSLVSKALGCVASAYPLGSYTINPNARCPIANNQRCSLLVKHKGIIIFQDQGDCPLSISVQCGNCKEDSHECNHQAYPGYCCVPCKETGEKLKNIASSIRR